MHVRFKLWQQHANARERRVRSFVRDARTGGDIEDHHVYVCAFELEHFRPGFVGRRRQRQGNARTPHICMGAC